MSIMHTYTLAIIFLFLQLSSYLELPNPISVEARKLISSDGVFKVDLIHRLSPLSPYYNSSMTPQEHLKKSPLGSISRGHSIHLSTAYYHTNGIDAELIDLIPNGGDYLIKIALGTPQVEFIASVDTGSDLIWVQCSPCENCIPQKSPLFDPTKSSTFHIIPCTSSACTYTDLSTGCLSNDNSHNNIKNNDSSPCGYEAGYGDGTSSVGVLATETITLPSSDATSVSLPSSVFGCGLQQQGRLGIQGEGIIGLGTGPSSLISQLGPKINHKFSYCLAPLTSEVTSKLTFGADVTGSPGVASTPFTTGGQDPESVFYHLTLDGISVGDKENSVQVPSGLDIIIDSGTTLTMLPASVYSSLRTALASAIKLSPVPSPRQPYDLCYNSGAQFSPPDVVFHFKGADVVLKAINTFRDIENAGVKCLAMLATDSQPIFGNIAQVNFNVGYDLQAKQVSIVPTDCTTTT